MTTSTAVRELPLNTVMPVNGTSFRQEAVRTCVEGDEVRVLHDTVNPHDPNACAVQTLDGRQLGYVPKHLAARLAGPHPGGRWRARILEVYRRETWGLRLQLGPLVVEGVRDRAGVDAPGLRHRGDGVAEGDGVVVTADVDTADGTADAGPGTGPAEELPAAEPEVPVSAKSGRPLGVLIERTDTRVIVRTPSGGRTAYPAAVVRVG